MTGIPIWSLSHSNTSPHLTFSKRRVTRFSSVFFGAGFSWPKDGEIATDTKAHASSGGSLMAISFLKCTNRQAEMPLLCGNPHEMKMRKVHHLFQKRLGV